MIEKYLKKNICLHKKGIQNQYQHEIQVWNIKNVSVWNVKKNLLDKKLNLRRIRDQSKFRTKNLV